MQQLLDTILKCQDKKTLKLFLEGLLTRSEIENLDKRYMIIQQLIAGTLTQRDIAKSLGVSIFNVSRGANLLKGSGEVFKDLLKL